VTRDVTVVIATTGRPTLERAIASVRQLLPGAKVMLVPSSGAFARVTEDPFADAVLNPTDNLYQAWNLAVTHIRDGYVCFVNDDDYFEGRGLIPAELPHNEIVNLRFRRTDRREAPPVSGILSTRLTRTIDLLHSNRRGNINSFLWPRGIFELVGPFDESYSIAADLEWMIRLLDLSPRVVSIAGPTYVQTRGLHRLSSMEENGDQALQDAERIVELIRGREPSSMVRAMFWVWLTRMRHALRRSVTE
jgi:hypothetical protein